MNIPLLVVLGLVLFFAQFAIPRSMGCSWPACFGLTVLVDGVSIGFTLLLVLGLGGFR